MVSTKSVFRFLLVFGILAGSVVHADAIDDILERGKLRVGIAEFVPWAMPAKRGGHVGHDVDLANKIAKDMGVSAELKVYEWKDLVPALEAGEVDVIGSGIAVTPQRALRISFTDPVAMSGVGMATNIKLTRDVENLQQLDDPKIVIATITNTFSEGVAKSIFDKAEFRSYGNADDAEKEVLEGRAHAYIAARPAVRFLVANNSEAIDLPLGEPLVGWAEAMAIQKGEQEFLNFLNAWITAHEADRWLATTREYWFDSLDWMQEVER